MLNLNYTLLSEGANSRYKIPSYRNYGHLSTYSEGYMITKITEFNQIMRECQVELSSIIPSDPEYVIPISEAGVVDSIVNTIRAIIKKVIDGIKTVFTAIKNFIISIIKNTIEKINNSSDKSVDKLRLSERVKILRKAIYDLPADQSVINSCDLNITRDLVSNDFPNTKFIGSKFSKMVINSIDNYVTNYDINNYVTGEKVEGHISNSSASESLADYLDISTNDIFSGIFGKYQYDITNPKLSAEEASIKAFGSNEIKSTKITVDLYLLACDNINSIKDINNRLDSELKDITKLENEIKDSLNKAQNSISKMNSSLSKTSKDHNLYEDYTEATRKLVNNLDRITNFVNKVIAVEMIIIRNKAERAATILSCSNSIKRKCNQIINNYIGTEESTNEAYDVRDAEMLEEQFESILCMTEEFWLENEYNQNIMQYVTEADGTGASTPTADPNASANPSDADKADSVQTNLANTQKGGKLDGAANFIDRFNQMFDRFRQTVLETLTKVDGPFWNRNRGQIQKINFMDSTVADWKMYDINKYATKLDIRYSDDAPYLNSDEEMQAEIFKKFSVAPNDQRFTQDDTFSKKMIKCFYDGYIEKGKATPLANAKFNNDITFKFCNDIIRNGFDGTYMGNIKEDRKFINESFKNAQKAKQTTTADKIADQTAQDQAQKMQNQQDTPSKAESAIIDTDKFNLAEHFGLVVGEKVINLNEVEINISQSAQQNTQGDSADGKSAASRADARMNRYFKYMTYALSAKMTSAFAAYKQFMGLYRAAYKKPKNNTQSTNNQNQQNTEQQQNQNPNAEGNK